MPFGPGRNLYSLASFGHPFFAPRTKLQSQPFIPKNGFSLQVIREVMFWRSHIHMNTWSKRSLDAADSSYQNVFGLQRGNRRLTHSK